MPSPYGLWTLDESPANESTTFVDTGSGGNNGSLVTGEGATDKSVAAGKFGRAVQFDGSNDTLLIANESNFDFNFQSFTVAAWVKDVTIGGVLVAKGNAFGASGWMVIVDSASWEVSLRDGAGNDVVLDDAVAPLPNFNDGNWHHVAAVIAFDTVTPANNSSRFYADGVLQNVAHNGAGGTPALNNVAVSWAARNGGASLFLGAKLDDLRIYNVGLSAEEIAIIAGIGGTPDPPGPSVAIYRPRLRTY